LGIIQGGIDKKNRYMDNFMAYHIIKKYWVEITISKVP
jgi:hypothetical protein